MAVLTSVLFWDSTHAQLSCYVLVGWVQALFKGNIFLFSSYNANQVRQDTYAYLRWVLRESFDCPKPSRNEIKILIWKGTNTTKQLKNINNLVQKRNYAVTLIALRVEKNLGSVNAKRTDNQIINFDELKVKNVAEQSSEDRPLVTCLLYAASCSVLNSNY